MVVRLLRCAVDCNATHAQLTAPLPLHPALAFSYIVVEYNNHLLILTQLHISVDDDHHRATNTKSERKVKYSSDVFTQWDSMRLQSLL
jgi:hypothetical protein